MGAEHAMDEYDLRILKLVQSNSRMGAEKIAETVGLSTSAVQRRLKRLRDSRIIEREIAVLSPEGLGRKLIAIVEIVMQRDRPLSSPQEEFKRLMIETPEIMQCYHVTGEIDFIVILTATDMEEYETLTRKLFVDNAAVRGYKTHIVMKRVKFGLEVPIV